MLTRVAGAQRPFEELVAHLTGSSSLGSGEAARLIDEVVGYFSEPADVFVRRRHGELKARSRLTTARSIKSRLSCSSGWWHRLSTRRGSCAASSTARSSPCAASSVTSEAGRGAHPAGGAASARVSRLRLGRHRGAAPGQAPRRQDARAGCASSCAAARAVQGQPGHRPHPLGDPWRAERRQRPPAHRRAGRIAVVHNGIIENAAALRAQLAERGVVFTSETDTEVLAHLIAPRDAPTRRGGRARRCASVVGAYGLAVIDAERPETLVVGAQRQPDRARHRRQGDVRRLRCRRAGAPHPPASCTSTTARSPWCAPTATRPPRSTAAPPSRALDHRRGRTRPSTRASTRTSCARRSREQPDAVGAP